MHRRLVAVTVALIDTDDDELADELARLALLAAVPAERAGPTALADPPRLVLTDAAGLDRTSRRTPCVLVSRVPLDVGALSAALDRGVRAALVLPADESRLIQLLLDAAADSTRGRLVAVVGASGGVGASTFAAGLAAVLGTDSPHQALLADLDPWGGGLDLLLGLEAAPGPRWSALRESRGRISGAALREVLPHWHGVAVLANDGIEVPAPALLAVAAAGVAEGGAVVLDLPRTGLGALTDSGLRLDRAVVVAADDVLGVAAARRLLPALAPLAAGTALVLLQASGAVDAAVVERTVPAPVVARLRVERALLRRLGRGDPAPPSRALLAAAKATVAGWAA